MPRLMPARRTCAALPRTFFAAVSLVVFFPSIGRPGVCLQNGACTRPKWNFAIPPMVLWHGHASVVGAMLLASPASSLVGAALSGASQAFGNSTQSSPMDGYLDALLRPADPSAQQQNPSDTRGEMVRLFATSFRGGGDLNPTNRTYVAKVVASRTGMSQADAEKRVNDVVTQVKTDFDKARKAAMQNGHLADALALYRRSLRIARRVRRWRAT